jgi:nucleotide-binding universal stress UspA family protein
VYKKILLAVDGSEHSQRATEEAVQIASLVKGSIIDVVFVAEFSKAKNEMLHADGKEALEVSRRNKLLPTVEKIKSKNLSYEVNILHGEPGPTIVDYVTKHDFELVVIGSRGLNTLQEMVLGSVSHKVVKRVQCPVLIVK